jgi:hypothetical protein
MKGHERVRMADRVSQVYRQILSGTAAHPVEYLRGHGGGHHGHADDRSQPMAAREDRVLAREGHLPPRLLGIDPEGHENFGQLSIDVERHGLAALVR